MTALVQNESTGERQPPKCPHCRQYLLACEDTPTWRCEPCMCSFMIPNQLPPGWSLERTLGERTP